MHKITNQGITDSKYFGFKRYRGRVEPGCGRPLKRAAFEK